MRRSDQIRRLRKLHGEMADNLRAAGIETVNVFLDDIENKTVEDIDAYTTWLESLKAGAYRAFMDVWGLKSPEWWRNMAMLGETDLREHKLLRPCAKDLRKAWRSQHRKTSPKPIPAEAK